jgi:hypothetical protein
MEVSRLYHWIEDDPTHGLILRITDSEIEMLKLGRKALTEMTMTQNTYHANAILDFVFPLLDKISEVKDGCN